MKIYLVNFFKNTFLLNWIIFKEAILLTQKNVPNIGTFLIYGKQKLVLFVNRTQNTFHKCVQSFFFIHSAFSHFMNFQRTIHIRN
jgi:hypothetical protein